MAAVLALFSGLLWGSADFAGGLASRRIPAVAVVGWGQLAALISLACAVLASSAWAGPTGWLGWAVLAGVVGSLALVCFYLALALGTMGVVSPIAAMGTVIPLAAGMIAGESPSDLQRVGIALALTGALFASGPELNGTVGRRSVLLAVLAGCGFGVALLAVARGSAVNPLMTTLGMRATSVAGFLLLAAVRRDVGGVKARDLPLLGMVGLADSAANLLYGTASRGQSLAVVSVLGGLYPVATVLLARVVLHERMRPVQGAGVGAALAGVALISAG